MTQRESVADKNKEAGAGQTLYADFEFAVCFLIGGWLNSDYDEKRPRSVSRTVQNSALQSPWTSRHPPASVKV